MAVYKCPHCPRKFDVYSTYFSHIQNKHSPNPPPSSYQILKNRISEQNEIIRNLQSELAKSNLRYREAKKYLKLKELALIEDKKV